MEKFQTRFWVDPSEPFKHNQASWFVRERSNPPLASGNHDCMWRVGPPTGAVDLSPAVSLAALCHRAAEVQGRRGPSGVLIFLRLSGGRPSDPVHSAGLRHPRALRALFDLAHCRLIPRLFPTLADPVSSTMAPDGIIFKTISLRARGNAPLIDGANAAGRFLVKIILPLAIPGT